MTKKIQLLKYDYLLLSSVFFNLFDKTNDMCQKNFQHSKFYILQDPDNVKDIQQRNKKAYLARSVINSSMLCPVFALHS